MGQKFWDIFWSTKLKKKQEHYLECRNKFQEEIGRSKNNIKKLDLIIQFIRELDKDCNDQQTEENKDINE